LTGLPRWGRLLKKERCHAQAAACRTFEPNKVCIVHCIQRCVRRAFLAGLDPLTGRDYTPRREWIRSRMECLASVFGIDVLTYAILSNHLHLVLRTRPDVVAQWSDSEVARRWLTLFPGQRTEIYLGAPTQNEIDMLARDSERLTEIRDRLSNPSWFMRALSEPIARLANQQDQCTGRFWEGRFKAQSITDEAGLLACSMYVDLNPIRAAMAQTPEESLHTSAYDRIGGLQGKTIPSAATTQAVLETEEAGSIRRSSTPAQLRSRSARARKRRGASILRDAWLAPLTIREKTDPLGAHPSKTGVRASDKGFLSLSLKDYLALLDWTGRNRPSMGKAPVPKHLEPILKRLGIDGSMWVDLVWRFKKYFVGGSVGAPDSLQEDAARLDRRWHRGQRAVRGCFGSG
jgi:REP element-mobilizing transposase RayT